jgi:leader peptidase (prepilin peptidase)/N-methyltransferase
MPSVFIWIWLAVVFLFGAAVGSFLNVCAARLPFEKSILWPGSHCFKCFQPVRWYDNLPLLSYWLLRGRCRRCGETFSVRYFLVELFTGLAFAGLFYADIVLNLPDLPLLRGKQHEHIVEWGQVPWRAWVVFGWHATLFGFLITAALCDLEHLEIPLSLTTTGTVVGLIGSTFLAWPFPATHHEPPPPSPLGIPPLMPVDPNNHPVWGVYPWPVFFPLPSWLPEGSPQLGLLTGLAGAVAGMVVLRAVRFLFGLGRGIEAMGLGDADLMMMAGAFVGWQPIVTAFLLAIPPGLVFGLATVFFRKRQEMPFGPALAVGVVLTVLFWPWIGRHYAVLFFEPKAILALSVISLLMLFLAAFLLRVLRGPAREEKEGKEAASG